MTLTIAIESEDADLTPENIHDLAREICESLNQELDADARLAPTGGGIGHKGDAVSVGTILLTIFGGGGVAVALVNVLNSFFNRSTNIKIEIKTRTGESLQIEASNLRADEIDKTVKKMKKLIGA